MCDRTRMEVVIPARAGIDTPVLETVTVSIRTYWWHHVRRRSFHAVGEVASFLGPAPRAFVVRGEGVHGGGVLEVRGRQARSE